MDKNYNIKLSYFKIAAKHTDSISICPNTPPWYMFGIAEDLACNKDLYNRYYKTLDITQDEFITRYYEDTLSKLDPYAVLEKYNGKILLGWHKPPKFDCRHVFAEWIRLSTGIVLPEATREDLSSVNVGGVGEWLMS